MLLDALLLALYVMLASVATAAPLTSEVCATYDQNTLWPSANLAALAADQVLEKSGNYAAFDAVVVTIVDADAGAANGGATNPDGSYSAVYFNASSGAIPPGLCDLPACSNSTGTMTCHPRCTTNPDGSMWAMSFFLGSKDVMVTIGCTPPEVAYYSQDTYISGRTNEEYPFYPGQNFGDTINFRNIKTADFGSPGSADKVDKADKGSQSESVFDAPTVIMTTADNAAYNEVNAAYQAAGVPDSAINLRKVDSATVRLWDRSGGKTWQESGADVLFAVNRVSIPKGNKDALGAYDKVIWPARLYMALNDDMPPSEPFVDVPLIPRVSQSESVMDEVKELTEVGTAVAEGVQKYFTDLGYSQSGYGQLTNTIWGTYDDWQAVLDAKNNETFIIPTRDALYGIPTGDQYFGWGVTKSAVIIGAIHSTTIKASYSEVSINQYNLITNMVVDSVNFVPDESFVGSASRFLPADKKDMAGAEFLFAVEVTPKGGCGNPKREWCYEFSKDRGVTMIGLGERIYSLASTGIGPDAATTAMIAGLVFEKDK